MRGRFIGLLAGVAALFGGSTRSTVPSPDAHRDDDPVRRLRDKRIRDARDVLALGNLYRLPFPDGEAYDREGRERHWDTLRALRSSRGSQAVHAERRRKARAGTQ